MSDRLLDLNLIRTFVAVAETGSFTAAADRLDITRPQASQQIARLEQRLGARLFDRTTRRVQLAEAGQRLLANCAPLLHGLHEAAEAVGTASRGLQGRLRVGAPVDHATQVLAPHLAAFAALHQGLDIELRASDRMSDLVEEGIDVAFRVGWLRDSTARAAKLGEFKQVVVAAPQYLAKAGIPQHPEDLASHRWVALTVLRSPLSWTFSHPSSGEASVRMVSTLRTDSAAAMRALLLAGAGVSVVSHLHVRGELDSGALIQMLPAWTLPDGGLYAVLPPGKFIPARSKALVDFMRARISSERSCPSSAP